jgi:hypothetical protein
MEGVFLSGARLQGANILGAKLTGAYIDEISTWRAITKGVNVTVLTDLNGAEPTVINVPPNTSDVHHWAASKPHRNNEEKYLQLMLEDETGNVQFFSLQVDNSSAVKEIVDLACQGMLSRIGLKVHLDFLTIFHHPARDELIGALNSAKCQNKSKFEELAQGYFQLNTYVLKVRR